MNISTHRTEREAIAAAKGDAQYGVRSKVFTLSGDTIIFSRGPRGGIHRRVEAGWLKNGHAHMSRKVAELI